MQDGRTAAGKQPDIRRNKRSGGKKRLGRKGRRASSGLDGSGGSVDLAVNEQRHGALMRRIARIAMDEGVQGWRRSHRLHRQKDEKGKNRRALSGFLEEVAQKRRRRHGGEYVIDSGSIAIFFLRHRGAGFVFPDAGM